MKPASRGASLVTLVYLLATLPVLLWRASGKSAWIVTLAHVAAVACLWWGLRARSTACPVADWLPLLLVPFLYAELPYLMGQSVVIRDSLVRAWETALFGTQPARTLANAMPYAVLSEVLHLGYVLYYPIVYVPPLLLYVAGRREEYGRNLLALMLTYVTCFLVFIMFPVEGPRYAWGPPPSVPDGPVRSLTLAILEHASSRGTAFPSSHAAVAVAQGVVALRFQRSVGVVVLATSVLLMIGAVYGGFHYAVDIVAGAVIGLAISLGVAMRPASG